MKNTSISGLLFLSLLLISFCSACPTSNYQNYYDDSENHYKHKGNIDTNDGVIFVVYDNQYHESNIYAKENEERYPVYDYRNGYSYRSEQVYYSEKEIVLNKNTNYYSNNRYSSENLLNWIFDGKKEHVVYQDKPQVYYTYTDYLDTYDRHECYTRPAKNKLIYVECP